MTVVVDASVLIAAAVDSGLEGQWAEGLVATEALSAPGLAKVEATNILRRLELAGEVEAAVATAAQRDLIQLDMVLFPFEPSAELPLLCGAAAPKSLKAIATKRRRSGDEAATKRRRSGDDLTPPESPPVAAGGPSTGRLAGEPAGSSPRHGQGSKSGSSSETRVYSHLHVE